MGYILLLLFFLIWRNVVHIRKAVYYSVYGTTKPKSIVKLLFNTLFDVRQEEIRKRQERKEKENKETTNEPNETNETETQK